MPQPRPFIAQEQTREDIFPVWQWDRLASAGLSDISKLVAGANLNVCVPVADCFYADRGIVDAIRIPNICGVAYSVRVCFMFVLMNENAQAKSNATLQQ